MEKLNGGGGIRTPMAGSDKSLQKSDKSTAETTQVLANTDTYENSKTGDFQQKLTFTEQSPDTFLHQKCALCVPKNLPDDLREVVDKWPELPDHIKSAIKTLIKGSG